MKAFFKDIQPCQVGMIVPDIDAARKAYAAMLGVDVPPIVDCGEYATTKTVYMDQPAPATGCTMAFFNLPNIQLELIQPNEAPSTWRDFLEQSGGGLHHYGFQVKDDIFTVMDEMKAEGYQLTQWGYYGDGSGAYAYFDCRKDLSCFIELLQSFNK